MTAQKLTLRKPRAEDMTELEVGDKLIGHGAVTNIVYPIGACLGCGRIINCETGEGHDDSRHTARPRVPGIDYPRHFGGDNG